METSASASTSTSSTTTASPRRLGPSSAFDPFAVQLYVYDGEELPALPRRLDPLGRREEHALRALVDGVLPGHLTEVIFDHERDPSDFVRALVSTFPNQVGVGVLDYANNGRLPVKRLAYEHPITDNSAVIVLVVDASLACRFHDAVARFDERTCEITPGPLIPKTDFWQRTDNTPLIWMGMAGLLADELEALRDICEADDGARIVIITEDARPEHGRGPWRPSHRFRDSRVRSTIGDAGRYYAHTRYLVESDDNGVIRHVVAVKDKAEGLTGRVLYEYIR